MSTPLPVDLPLALYRCCKTNPNEARRNLEDVERTTRKWLEVTRVSWTMIAVYIPVYCELIKTPVCNLPEKYSTPSLEYRPRGLGKVFFGWQLCCVLLLDVTGILGWNIWYQRKPLKLYDTLQRSTKYIQIYFSLCKRKQHVIGLLISENYISFCAPMKINVKLYDAKNGEKKIR